MASAGSSKWSPGMLFLGFPVRESLVFFIIHTSLSVVSEIRMRRPRANYNCFFSPHLTIYGSRIKAITNRYDYVGEI